MSERPAPDREAPEGFEFRAVVDKGWRIDAGHPCRMQVNRQPCRKPSVAAFLRGWTRQSWWAYCADHMYGRWIEDGQVMQWIVRRIGDES